MDQWLRRFMAFIVCLYGLAVSVTYAQTPATTDASSFIYFAPQPHARFVSPATTISLRTKQPLNEKALLNLFTVAGSRSGIHSGAIQLAADQQTLIYTPDQPFAADETVTVQLAAGLKTRAGTILPARNWQFHTSALRTPAAKQTVHSSAYALPFPVAEQTDPTHIMTHTSPYRTAPASLPVIDVVVPATDTAEGFIWASNFIAGNRAGTRAFLLMVDDNGEPVYYQEIQPGVITTDFRRLGENLYTYHNSEHELYYIYDQQYQLVDVYDAGNGYPMDLHEFLLLPNGHALFMIYDLQPVDMSQVVAGGDPDATVIGLIIQEMDPAHNVVFEWRSWDHIPITDGYVDFTAPFVDYIHGNSIEVDHDGNLLVSNRHTSNVIKINRQTGAVMWHLGGKQNDFTFSTGVQPFHAQHDARRLENGNLLLFNNWSTQPFSEDISYSSAQEFTLDEVNMTATLVHEYRHTPDVVSVAMGSSQRLENGNTGIGWGSARTPFYSEFKPDGSLAFELAFAEPTYEVSYRAKRYPWVGSPPWPPALVVERNAAALDLFMSWNGATEATSYTISTSPNLTTAFTPRETVARSGFETQFTITDAPADLCLVQIEARDASGAPLARSPRVHVPDSACTYQQIMLPVVRR